MHTQYPKHSRKVYWELMNINVCSNFDSKTIKDQFLADDEISKKTSKLDLYLGALEEELRKVDAFKRELPNCMRLLEHAIERLKEEKLQLQYCRGREMGPVMKEFMVLKSDKSSSEGDGSSWAKVSNDFSEKKKWMSCVQLWSSPVEYEENNQDRLTPRKEEDETRNGCSMNMNMNMKMKMKKRGGAYASLLKTVSFGKHLNEEEEEQRKERRFWSPELHRKFLDALHQLGGPKSATPKQIREVMKVDGLTNDQVKSHLQKYRIHIRKHPGLSSKYP